MRLYVGNVIDITGFAVCNVPKDHYFWALSSSRLTSDQPIFYKYIEEISKLFLYTPEYKISVNSINSFLILIHRDLSADIYLNNFPIEIKCRSKRILKENELISDNDIADIIELRFPGIDIQESDKVICCLKVGWKFGLYFNCVRNPNLVQKEIGSLEFEEVELERSNLARMQTQLGQLYRYLAFQYVYQSLESEPLFEEIVADGWFPFVEILGNEYKTLFETYQNDKFTYDDKVKNILDGFNETRLRKITNKWWENPFFREKRELLQTGIDAFLRRTKRDYISCVKNLYPEIEGILRSLYRTDHEEGTYRTQKLLEHLLEVGKRNVTDDHSLLLPQDFLKYLNSSFFKHFDPATATEDLSRHSVAHGAASEKGYSAEKALQALLTLDQIYFYLSTPSNENEKNNSPIEDAGSDVSEKKGVE
ncbi:hypothetical protein J5I95_05775 [Candidatus Poribacteria bacterium]|nr:hypothetical protein [Candidatus Poribacteria bacterium]